MRFQRVRLEQFKPYADADLRLDAGVTVIHGLNGSGKSSLLEACFFALYGARALDETLEEVVTIGAESAAVELWFAHAGGDYRVEREVRVHADGAQTTTCVLEGPDGSYEGARDVRARVAELLRMDSEAFVNCAYVRQGEVNKLINASPDQRQDMIDDLLQLGTLETYRERASDARLGVKHVLDDKRGALSKLEEQIEAKEAADLHERLNARRTDLAEVEEEIERLEDERETAVATKQDAEDVLDEHEERQAELAELEAAIEELREEVEAGESEREDLGERVREQRETVEECREELAEAVAATALDEAGAVDERLEDVADRAEAVRDEIEDLRVAAQEHAGTAESRREAAADLAERAEDAREEAAEVDEAVAELRDDLAETRERVEALETEIDEATDRFADAPVAFGEADAFRESVAADLADAREAESDLKASVEATRAAVEEAEALLAAGKCPECGQDVEDSPHVESLEEDREELAELEADLAAAREEREALEDRLETAEELREVEAEVERLRERRETAEDLLSDREETIAERTDRAAELRETAEELAAEAETKREEAEAASQRAESTREEIGALNEELADLRERETALERVAECREAVADGEDDLERLREKRDALEERNDLRRERLAEKRERREELEAGFDEATVEEAREDRERAEAFLEEVDEALADKREARDDIRGDVGAVQQELRELETLREDREALAGTVERLESLYDEAEQLEAMYGDLRTELRQRNVRQLEAMLNETFSLVYGNDAYDRIELDGGYELTVYQKDGEPLDPGQLSGGERALFNLSLRAAVYRLLAEGIEGAAPMPPLILDEPTVFLDAGHVSRLVDLVESMRDLGVEQIVVVSHDEELVAAADDVVTVRKDPTTNRSSVERRAEAPVPAADD